jgi:hypothetical protein
VPRFLSLLLVGLVGRPAPALAQLELQAFLGTAVSAPSPLWITQRGQPGLDLTNPPAEIQKFAGFRSPPASS